LELHIPMPVIGELEPTPMVRSVHLHNEAIGCPEEIESVRLGEGMPLEGTVPFPALRPFVGRERPLQSLLGRAVPARQSGQRWICDGRCRFGSIAASRFHLDLFRLGGKLVQVSGQSHRDRPYVIDMLEWCTGKPDSKAPVLGKPLDSGDKGTLVDGCESVRHNDEQRGRLTMVGVRDNSRETCSAYACGKTRLAAGLAEQTALSQIGEKRPEVP
jgi:hypothetical protein